VSLERCHHDATERATRRCRTADNVEIIQNNKEGKIQEVEDGMEKSVDVSRNGGWLMLVEINIAVLPTNQSSLFVPSSNRDSRPRDSRPLRPLLRHQNTKDLDKLADSRLPCILTSTTYGLFAALIAGFDNNAAILQTHL
jgi:hypothetical protein